MTIEVVRYDPRWPERFSALGTELRSALGAVARRIDHIGSTAVPGLVAKPVIDIQVSVADLDPDEPFAGPLRDLGYHYRRDNPDRCNRYFREPAGRARTHVHVRREGSFSEQFALLFRDYLRSHPGDATEYGELKQRLAGRFSADRTGYTDAKGPLIWDLIRRADEWAQREGWKPEPSDR